MTEHTRPQTLSANAIGELLGEVDGETARKILGIIGRDRVFVGCACAAAHEAPVAISG